LQQTQLCCNELPGPTSEQVGEYPLQGLTAEAQHLRASSNAHRIHDLLMVLNKLDLLPYVPFSLEQARENARRVHPGIEIIEISCMTGEGLDRWMDWLQSSRRQSLTTSSA
jgi:GTPase Era involved in 16S rRNA processing